MNDLIKKALYKAQYRGTKELDLIFRQFVEKDSESAIRYWTEEDWILFLELLDQSEEDLTRWFLNDLALPDQYYRFTFVLKSPFGGQRSLIPNLDALDLFAQTLAFWVNMHRDEGVNFGFIGDLGAGKTTLCKKLISKILHINEVNVKSPTFNIFQEYNDDQMKIVHSDLYRLKNTEDLFELDILDYIHSKSHCVLIEWPNLIEPYIKDNYIKVNMMLERSSEELFPRVISMIREVE